MWARGVAALMLGARVEVITGGWHHSWLSDAPAAEQALERQGRLDTELDRLQRIALLIVDEVGYIPFDPQAADLMFCSSAAAPSAPR